MWETIASSSYILLFFFVLINAKAVYHLKKVYVVVQNQFNLHK